MTAKANSRSIRSLMKKLENGDKLNILTFATHERYEENLCETGHNFYSIKFGKTWDTTYAPVPKNYYILDQIPPWLDIDLVLSHTSCNRIQVAHDLLSETQGQQNKLSVPIIRHCHVLPDVRYDVDEQTKNYRNIPVDFNCFISDFNRDAWGFSDSEAFVIEHGVNTEFWKDAREEKITQEVCLSVVNDFPNRDWCCGFNLWKEVTENLPRFVVGKSKGFSKAAQSKEQLRDYYCKSRLFLNTSLHSPVPTVLLEAMSCGCPVVSTKNCMIADIIKHGKNGFLSNDPVELNAYCNMLLRDEKLANTIGENARQTVCENFGLDRFVAEWNNLFYKTIEDFVC